MELNDLISIHFENHQNTLNDTQNTQTKHITDACNILIECIKSDKKILLVGNGGSAADAQHIAAEFTGRFVKERNPLPAIALTTDTSAITAIGNDYGFNNVFERQILALANAGDVLICISTSGNSNNIINAIKAAKSKKVFVIGLTGNDGGNMNNICDINIVVPSSNTANIQEMHILIGHIFCSAIDNLY